MNPNEAAGAFSFASPVTAMSECDRGHINHTYFWIAPAGSAMCFSISTARFSRIQRP